MTLAHLYLTLAIFFEIIGTTCLKLTESFTKPIPSLIVIVGYLAAMYFLTLSVRTLPIGFVYAVWAGVGIAVVALLGVLIYDEAMDWPGVVGITMIIGGVVVLNVFSKAGGHA